MATPNMGLDLPSPLVTLGPAWAQLLNDALDVIDAHDHTPGNGAPIGTAALNIDGNLDFAGFAINSLGRASLVNLGGIEATPRSLYSFGGELYYTDASGNAVQLTIGGTAAGGGGSIDGLVSPASAYYNSGAQTFEWSVNASLRANLDFGRAIFRENNASSGAAITLGAPTSGVSAYTITLPPAAPVGGTTRLVSSPAGSSAPLAWISADGSSIEISGSTLQVKASGITTAKIAAGNVTGGISGTTPTGSLAYRTIVTENLAQSAVTTAKIATGNVTGGVSGTTATGSIAYRTIVTENLAEALITTAKIATGNVTGGISGTTPTGSLGYRTIATENLAESAITTAKIAAGNVTGGISGTTPTGSIGYRTIATENLAEALITTAKIAAGNVTGGVSGTTPTGSIGYRTIATENLANSAVTTAKIATGNVTGGVSGTTPTGSIGYRTVATENIAELAITTGKLATNAVSPAKIRGNYYLGSTIVSTVYGALSATTATISAFNDLVIDPDEAGTYLIGYAPREGSTDAEITGRSLQASVADTAFFVYVQLLQSSVVILEMGQKYVCSSANISSPSLVQYRPTTAAAPFWYPILLSAGTYTLRLILSKPSGIEVFVNQMRGMLLAN